MSWVYPEFFPSDCPPPSARNLPGKYYRLIRRIERCKTKDFLPEYSDSQLNCPQCAISIFSNKKEIINLVLQHPRMQQKYLAELTLDGDCGVMINSSDKSSYSSHYDWWIPKGLECTSYCTSIEQIILTVK